MMNLKGINKDRNPTVPCYRPSGTMTFLSRQGSCFIISPVGRVVDTFHPVRWVRNAQEPAPSLNFSGKSYADFTTLEPGFVLQERIADPEVRSRDSQRRAHLGLSQEVHRPVSSATPRT